MVPISLPGVFQHDVNIGSHRHHPEGFKQPKDRIATPAVQYDGRIMVVSFNVISYVPSGQTHAKTNFTPETAP
jgi:hypothetical protein